MALLNRGSEHCSEEEYEGISSKVCEQVDAYVKVLSVASWTTKFCAREGGLCQELL